MTSHLLCQIVSINSSLLTITLYYLVRKTLIYNDTKHSVPFITLYLSFAVLTSTWLSLTNMYYNLCCSLYEKYTNEDTAVHTEIVTFSHSIFRIWSFDFSAPVIYFCDQWGDARIKLHWILRWEVVGIKCGCNWLRIVSNQPQSQ